MKTGTVQVNGVYLSCPECDEAIVEPNTGSQLFDAGEYEQIPNTVKCDNCGASFRKPAFPTQRKKAA